MAATARSLTSTPWGRVAISAPVAAFHTRAVSSSEPVTTRVPSAENASDVTAAVWPVNVATSAPVATW